MFKQSNRQIMLQRLDYVASFAVYITLGIRRAPLRVFAVCMPCQIELGHPSIEPFSAPYYEDRIAKIKCSRGHESVVMLQSQKFEVLLDSGVNALEQGFTLEAAATFSAALERFYEFASRTMLHHLGMSESTYEGMFSEMARQSERQIGAFLTLHALVLGTPFVPEKSIAPFRNSVIHKGKIPTPSEAEEFCTSIYAEILRVLEPLRTTCKPSIQAVVMTDLHKRTLSLAPGTPVATSAGIGLLSLAVAVNKPTFDAARKAFVEAVLHLDEATPQMLVMHKALFPGAT